MAGAQWKSQKVDACLASVLAHHNYTRAPVKANNKFDDFDNLWWQWGQWWQWRWQWWWWRWWWWCGCPSCRRPYLQSVGDVTSPNETPLHSSHYFRHHHHDDHYDDDDDNDDDKDGDNVTNPNETLQHSWHYFRCNHSKFNTITMMITKMKSRDLACHKNPKDLGSSLSLWSSHWWERPA